MHAEDEIVNVCLRLDAFNVTYTGAASFGFKLVWDRLGVRPNEFGSIVSMSGLV